jgi:hypothetical protein
MRREFATLIAGLGLLMLAACATAAGTAVGAGIGHVAGDTKTGALIGGGAGLLYDIFG